MAAKVLADLPKSVSPALTFEIVAKCPVTKARSARMTLPHGMVRTPVFMPVGTQGTLKGLLPEQVEQSGCRLMLGNTYHLGSRPGSDLVAEAGGLHKFMNWKYNLLTDSGGFQMVSLSKRMEMTEEGVKFLSPYTDQEMLLTPEKSIQIQNQLGADIIMQLDDVVHSLTQGPRVEEAMHRTLRWLDRCIAAHERPNDQNLFPIVQGALDPELRKYCVKEIIKRDTPGYAIGGLSGGEEKAHFWRMVDISTDYLPVEKPRYLMGVGFAVDLIVCSALGVDMFDCVYPTRTARFGRALVPGGQLTIRNKEFERDYRPIDDQCTCSTCKTYTRSYLNSVATHETVGAHLLTVHNVHYQMRLMDSVQKSIEDGRFPEFIKDFMKSHYPKSDYPEWVVDALKAVNVELL